MTNFEEGILYEEYEVVEITREHDSITMNTKNRKVAVEISLKIIVNNLELVSLLCMNVFQSVLELRRELWVELNQSFDCSTLLRTDFSIRRHPSYRASWHLP